MHVRVFMWTYVHNKLSQYHLQLYFRTISCSSRTMQNVVTDTQPIWMLTNNLPVSLSHSSIVSFRNGKAHAKEIDNFFFSQAILRLSMHAVQWVCPWQPCFSQWWVELWLHWSCFMLEAEEEGDAIRSEQRHNLFMKYHSFLQEAILTWNSKRMSAMATTRISNNKSHWLWFISHTCMSLMFLISFLCTSWTSTCKIRACLHIVQHTTDSNNKVMTNLKCVYS